MTTFANISSKINDLFGYSPTEAQLLQRPDLISIALDAIAANIMTLTEIAAAINTLMGTAYTNDELKQRPDLLRLGIMVINADGDNAIADESITAAKLAANAVTTSKILDGNVTAAKLAANAVTTSKILDGNVTTAKIADGAITAPKLNGAQTGTAPIYGVRAAVNFNGNDPISIRGGFNISSLIDLSSGTYRASFTTPLPNANYAVAAFSSGDGAAPSFCYEANTGNNRDNATTTSFDFQLVNGALSATTRASVNLIVVG